MAKVENTGNTAKLYLGKCLKLCRRTWFREKKEGEEGDFYGGAWLYILYGDGGRGDYRVIYRYIYG